MPFSIIYTIINSGQSLETARANGSLSLDGLQICTGVERQREVAGAQKPFPIPRALYGARGVKDGSSQEQCTSVGECGSHHSLLYPFCEGP